MSTRLPEQPDADDTTPPWFRDGSACPPWCARGHVRALTEGASLDAASQHVGRPIGGRLPEIRNAADGRLTRPGGGGWELVTVQEPMPNGLDSLMEAAVEFELRDGELREARARFTSGEARTLSAQLGYAADLLDLDG